MTALEEFYESYLHYSVAQRLFEDTCRQLVGFKGSVDERQQLVDETLRLAICVSDNIDDTESLIPDVLEYLHSENGDPDIIHAISLITNNLKEDRARANSYSNFVTYRRIGNRARKPRRPQIANPFIPIVDDGPVEAIVISPKDPENVVRMTMDDAPVDITSVRSEGELDGRHSVEDLPAEDGDDVEDDSAVTEDDDTKDTHVIPPFEKSRRIAWILPIFLIVLLIFIRHDAVYSARIVPLMIADKPSCAACILLGSAWT